VSPETLPVAPAVSVIVPCYNAESYLAETIQSVLEQSYPDFELILVDDGSTDRTGEILASFSDPRARVYRQANAGVSTARNRGVAESCGRYLAFLDSDDVWLPRKLERQVRVLEEDPAVGLVYSDVFVMDEAGRPEGTFSERMALPRGWVFRGLLARNFIATSTVVMRRAVFDAVGPFVPFRVSQDYDLWLKCAARYPVERVPEPLVRYRRRPGGISRRVMIPLEECLEIYTYWSRRLGPEEQPLIRRAAGELLYLSGKTELYEDRDARLARRLFLDALRRRPGLGPALFWLLTFLPVGWTLRARSLTKALVGRTGWTRSARAASAAAGRPGVLMLAPSYHPEIAGGGALQCHTLVRALQDRVEFQVLSVSRPSDLPERDMVEGVPVFRIKLDPASLKERLGAARRLVEFFIANHGQFSLVHCHGFTQKTLLVIGLAKLFRKRIILKMTSYGVDDPLSLRRGPLGLLRFAALKAADRLVGVSPAFAERVKQSGLPAEGVLTIANGVDTDRFAPVASVGAQFALRRSLGLPVDLPVLAFVGHFSRDKGVENLVNAWLALRQNGRRAYLLLIGSTSPDMYEVDPELVESIRSAIKEAAADQDVEFVGCTTEVAAYLRASDLFVLPSHREGLSNALLEAMACELACVASRLPGVTDHLIVHGSNGILVSPGDAGGLVAVLEELLSGPELRRRLGARARETVLAEYGIARVASRYLSLYWSLSGQDR